MGLSRRSFLSSAISLVVAPAICKAEFLLPVTVPEASKFGFVNLDPSGKIPMDLLPRIDPACAEQLIQQDMISEIMYPCLVVDCIQDGPGGELVVQSVTRQLAQIDS